MERHDATRYSLIERLVGGQPAEAWDEFLRIYTPLVYRLARRFGLQDADAADVTQEVFCTVARSLECFECDRQAGSFRAWLLAVTRSRLADFRRSRQPAGQGTGDTAVHERLAQEPSEDDCRQTWEAEYQRSIFRWAAKQVECEFANSTWQAFWAVSVQGRPAPEVAGELNMSTGAVYIAKSRVTARLREKVREVDD